MSAMQRRKGANAEREFAQLIDDWIGVRLRRRLGQYQSGGCDLEMCFDQSGPVALRLSHCAIEVKRMASVTTALLESHWRQAVRQADEAGKVPVLAYRADRQPWRVVVPLELIDIDLPRGDDSMDYTATMSIAGFCAVIRETS